MSQINSISAQASAQVNGIANQPKTWRDHARVMIGGSHEAAYAACKFMRAAVNNAISNADTAAIDWLRGMAARKAPISQQAAKRCIRCVTAALFGRTEATKAGFTVPDGTPEIKDWTVDMLQGVAKHGWQTRKADLLDLWTGKAPVRFEKSVQQKSAQERLESLAKSMARLMIKEGFDLATVEKAITDAKANVK